MTGRWRRPGRLLLLAAVFSAACQDTTIAPSNGSAAPAAPPTATALAPTPAAIPVADISTEAEAVEGLRREIATRLAPDPELADADARISAVERRIGRLRKGPALSSSEEIQLVELQELDGELRDMDSAGSRLEATLSARARALDADLATLQALRQRWAETIPAASSDGAPESIRNRAAATAEMVEELQGSVRQRRDELLTQLDRVSRIRSSLAATRAETADRRATAQRHLFAISEAPIWHTAWAGRQIGRAAGEQLARDAQRLTQFARQRGRFAGVRFLLLFLGSLAFLFALRKPALECARVDPFARGPIRLIERPLAAAMLTALLALVLSMPVAAAPLLFWDILWVLLILSTSILLRQLLGSSVERTLYVLTVAACLVPLRYLYEQDPLLDRLVLIVQAGIVGATFAADLAAGKWKQVFRGRFWERLATAVVVAAIILLATSLVLVVIGYVAPARLLRSGAIASLGLGLIFLGAYSLLYALLSSLLATRPLRALRLVQNHSAAIRLFLRRALAVVALLEWAFWSLTAFGARDLAILQITNFLKASFSIGSATVSVSGILTFLLVLGATFLLAALVRFALDGEILPRLKLERGLPFTISTTVRYAILVTGFLFAFSAAGISLSRMTLLAGALGVGLGFGLQNLVSNFVSGLILLFERPIQVGDVVDVGTLVGEVRRIGMRSSTVRTAEGAEVVVPNADLISKTVINWTLSDRRRRVEIRVGVAYGSDPEKVIGLLLQAGAGHPEALTDPAPTAYFTGFGDSSLDFVLHVWVARFEQGLALQSAVRRAVHRVLAEAGIEIPFPQRDLNLKWVAPEVSETLDRAREAAGKEPAG